VSKGGTTHDIQVLSGGALNVAGTVTSDVAVFAGGIETVSSGGLVSGSAGAGTNISAGTVNVLSGGTFEFTTVFAGGKLNISKGGRAASIVVSSGGNLNVAGTTTSNVTVSSGGMETVSSGGVASGTTIAGGTVEITSGGSTGGTVTFAANSGTLQLDHSTTFSGTVAGMTAQDTLDLRDINFATAVITPSFTNATSGTLTVTDGTHTAHILLLGNYMASTFTASNDTFGGTSIVDPHVSAAQTVSLAQPHKG
jgi:autotransporter passenger strand-loop-strand repeat protein